MWVRTLRFLQIFSEPQNLLLSFLSLRIQTRNNEDPKEKNTHQIDSGEKKGFEPFASNGEEIQIAKEKAH